MHTRFPDLGRGEREGSNVANELLQSQTLDPDSGCDGARVTRHGSGQDFRQDDT